ncbi:hypothetical protein ACP70R_016559 [Stipagrostis hirtigluma subsp. patula]
MPKPPADERPRLTLEDYVLFFTTRAGQGLTMDHLNQIICMHGFIKLHRHTKPVMVDALNSFDLMRPRRSTVPLTAAAPPPGAAPAAAATLSTEEATRDIEDLGWRECPVGSLLSIRAGMRVPAAAAASPVPLASIAPANASPVERISPPSTLNASSALATLAALAPAPASPAERISPPSLLSASSPLPPALPAPTRKRSGTGKGKAAMRTRKRRMEELLTLPSLEMPTCTPPPPSSAPISCAGPAAA